MRYFLQLSYNGVPFHGWQRQPNAISVQQTIEEALGILLQNPVQIVGAGRTDTGVNARIMYAHFDTESPIVDVNRFLIGLNRLCGRDIAVSDIRAVEPESHARFDAISRTYRYFISYRKSPFLYPLSWYSPSILDMEAMNKAAAILPDVSDFTSFAKLHSDSHTNICRVKEAYWENWNNTFDLPGIYFTITADRFLRNMVRAVVGTLIDIGRGKINIDDFKRIINEKNRCSAGTSMPPQALYLWDIEYTYIR